MQKGQERIGGRKMVESCNTFCWRTQIFLGSLNELPSYSRGTSIPVESCVHNRIFTSINHGLYLSSLLLQRGVAYLIGEI